MGRGAVRYHQAVVAEGFEPPGTWLGAGAAELGLAGTVTGAELGEVLAGRHPGTGESLRRRPAQVPGSELLFQVPKSVSVLWGVAAPDVAAQVIEATSGALQGAVRYLEAEAVVVGADRPASGMVAAGFLHRTSRLADPHLHVHLLVANLGRRDDGRWMAVNRLVLSSYLGAAGFLFESHLRHELSARLGLSFGPVVNGVAQISGVPDEVLTAFSRRRGQVERNAARYSGASPAARRLAALTDRPERHPGLAAEQLREEWQERAAAAGLDVSGLGLGPSGRASALAAAERDEVDLGEVVGGLSELSSFSRRDVVKAVAALAPHGFPGTTIRDAVERVLSAPPVVRAPGVPVLRSGDVRRLRSRPPVVLHSDQATWTTAPELERRRHLAEVAAADGRVEVVTAGPGPARSDYLAACRESWSDQGLRVMGLAADAASARRVEATTGIDTAPHADVVDRLRALAGPVVSPTILVATGVEQYGSRSLVDLVDVASRTGCRLVLVADPISTRDTDRSGGWRAVAEVVGHHVVRRQAPELDDPVTRGAPRGLVGGGDTVADVVFQVGAHLAISGSAPGLRERLVRDWHEAGPSSVMVAASRADVEDLNRRARVLLDREGALSGTAREVGGLEARIGDRLIVSAVETGARRRGWALGQEWVVGADGLEPSGPPGPLVPSGPGPTVDGWHGVGFRYAYAATPYQMSRQERTGGPRSVLVLGPPDVMRDRPAAARFYVVADLADARHLAASAERTDDRRWQAVARAAEIEPPTYLVSALGSPPPDAAGRARWRSAAGAVERFRQRWDIADDSSALGPDAGGPLRRAQRREVQRQIDAAARGPERSRTMDGRGLSGPGLSDRARALGS